MIQFVGLRNLLRRYVVKWFDCIIRTIFFWHPVSLFKKLTVFFFQQVKIMIHMQEKKITVTVKWIFVFN